MAQVTQIAPDVFRITTFIEPFDMQFITTRNTAPVVTSNWALWLGHVNVEPSS